MKIAGKWYNGETSSSLTTTLVVDEQGVAQLVGIARPPFSIGDIVIPPRVANSSRYIRFADGSVFETKDNAGVDALQHRYFAGKTHLNGNFINRLEKSWPVALCSLLLIGAFIGWFAIWGVPTAARAIAFALPSELSMSIGRDSLQVMDHAALQPTALATDRQQALEKIFASLLPGDREGLSYRLVFRKGGSIGANAFALPDASIIVTDELVGAAENDQQLAAVLLHEIGHVKQRHALRQIIQQAGLLGMLSVITGDISGASHAVLAAPGMLIQASYSRDAEWEADSYALEYLQAHQLSPLAFANMMRNMKNWRQVKSDANTEDDVILRYLSTHPATDDRIKRFEDAAGKTKAGDDRGDVLPQPHPGT